MLQGYVGVPLDTPQKTDMTIAGKPTMNADVFPIENG